MYYIYIVNDDQRIHLYSTLWFFNQSIGVGFHWSKRSFSYKTVLGSNSFEKTIVGEKRKFSALSPAEINSSIFSAGHQESRDLRTIIGPTGRPSSRAIQHYDTYLSQLSFWVGDLLLNLLMRSFYPPKSILRTRVPTIGSVRFLLLRNVTPRWWVLHWVLFGIIMIPLLNGNLLQLRQVSTLRPAYVVDRTQNPPLRSMDPSQILLFSRCSSFRQTTPAWISLLVSPRVSLRSALTWAQSLMLWMNCGKTTPAKLSLSPNLGAGKTT